MYESPCMCVGVYVSICMCVSVSVCVCVCTWICICIFVYVCVYLYAFVCVCAYVYVYVCVYDCFQKPPVMRYTLSAHVISAFIVQVTERFKVPRSNAGSILNNMSMKQ